MGWKWQQGLVSGGPPHRFNGKVSVGPDWNPDTNHEQFFEMWKKLSKSKILKILEILKISTPINKTQVYVDPITIIRIFANPKRLPEVCQAFIEVIKESNEKD